METCKGPQDWGCIWNCSIKPWDDWVHYTTCKPLMLSHASTSSVVTQDFKLSSLWLRYNLHTVKGTNLRWTVQWIFTHVYARVTTTQISIENTSIIAGSSLEPFSSQSPPPTATTVHLYRCRWILAVFALHLNLVAWHVPFSAFLWLLFNIVFEIHHIVVYKQFIFPLCCTQYIYLLFCGHLNCNYVLAIL